MHHRNSDSCRTYKDIYVKQHASLIAVYRSLRLIAVHHFIYLHVNVKWAGKRKVSI